MDYQTYKQLSQKEKADLVSAQLKKEFPDVSTPLNHSNAFELLMAVMLSAQTLDDTVNKVTPALFSNYSTPHALANASLSTLEKTISTVNFYKTKARNLIKMGEMLESDFGGKVPNSLSDLTKIPGVGRKTANVVINEWFAKQGDFLDSNVEGFVVDTHVKRVANRLGLTSQTDPEKVEQDLMDLFPKKDWAEMSLRMIFHGRYMCTAKKPQCNQDPFWGSICECAN